MELMAPSEAHRGGAACAHAFCRPCLSGHVRAKVETGTGAVVRCPDPSCAGTLDPELCRAALPSDVFERWCAKLCESMFLGARRTYCPFPDCSEMMVADEDGGGGEGCVTQSECQVCRRLFCARCGVAPWHAGVTCDEYQRLARGDRGREDMMLYEMAEGMKWKRCPSCQFFVEKVVGCQHINCR
jgi:E3 ubiquitin-protein ligase RNF144